MQITFSKSVYRCSSVIQAKILIRNPAIIMILDQIEVEALPYPLKKSIREDILPHVLSCTSEALL